MATFGSLRTALLTAAVVAVAIVPWLLEATAVTAVARLARATVAAVRAITAVAALLERTSAARVMRTVAVAAAGTGRIARRFALAIEARTLAERAALLTRLEIAARTIPAVTEGLCAEGLSVALRAATVAALAAMVPTLFATMLE